MRSYVILHVTNICPYICSLRCVFIFTYQLKMATVTDILEIVKSCTDANELSNHFEQLENLLSQTTSDEFAASNGVDVVTKSLSTDLLQNNVKLASSFGKLVRQFLNVDNHEIIGPCMSNKFGTLDLLTDCLHIKDGQVVRVAASTLRTLLFFNYDT